LKFEWWGVPLVEEEKYQGKGTLRYEIMVMMTITGEVPYITISGIIKTCLS
jgi:hypothetical protein